jgi:Flp pilus assembly protein TadG
VKEDADMTARKDSTRDERGVAMMYVAVFLMSSLWLVSLAIDMGKLTVTKGELQRAADAAALAGASAVDPGDGTLMQDSARVLATYTASLNTALRENSEAVLIDSQADIDFPTPNKIRVVARREESAGNPMTTIFARTLGINTLNLRATATAEAIPVDEPCERMAPMAPVQIDGGYSTECGTFYRLKMGSGPQSDPLQGNFQLLDYGEDCNEGPCAGIQGIGPRLECWTLNGYGCCIKIGDQFVDTEPGNHVGTMFRALKDLWELDTDKAEGICYQAYKGNGRRVVTTPIVETFDLNGKKTAEIVGFAAFFLVSKPEQGGQASEAYGQFINYVVPGDADEEPPVGPKLFTLRLVENPTP